MRKTARSLCALSILLTAVAPAASPSASSKRIEPVDIVELREVSDPQISPDGKSIVYSILRRLSGAEHDEMSVWLVPADGSKPERPLVAGEGESGNARWAPDSKRIAFLSSRANPLDSGKHSRQLWLLSLDGGEAQPLTKIDGDIADFRWPPDGQSIAFLASDPLTAAVRARVVLHQDAVEVDANPQMQRVWIYDFRSRSARCDGTTTDEDCSFISSRTRAPASHSSIREPAQSAMSPMRSTSARMVSVRARMARPSPMSAARSVSLPKGG